MIFEVCTDSFRIASLAKKYNINRIELCSALSVGGLTPSIPLAKMFADHKEFETHAMIRPRAGDFCYSNIELDIMQKEIHLLASQGIKGVVFGCLTDQGKVNVAHAKKLFDTAKKLNLEVTFHRAFDYALSPIEALETLIDLKIDRLLTSGLKEKAIEGIELIKELVAKSDNQIEIMAGSGVNKNNAMQLANAGVDALHFSAHKILENSDFEMGVKVMPDEGKIASIVKLFE